MRKLGDDGRAPTPPNSTLHAFFSRSPRKSRHCLFALLEVILHLNSLDCTSSFIFIVWDTE